MAGEKPGPPILAVAGANNLWDFTTGVYDAVFVKAYNTGIRYVYPNPLEPGSPDVNESKPDIIATA